VAGLVSAQYKVLNVYDETAQQGATRGAFGVAPATVETGGVYVRRRK